MLPRKIASRYAEALFDLAQQQGKTAEYEEALVALAQVIDASSDLREVLTHPEIPLQQKERLINSAFQGKVAPEVLSLLFLLIRRGHDPDMRTVHDIFVLRWNQVRRLQPVTVTSAVPLSGEQTSALASALSRRTGATVQIEQAVDPELIAGIVVRIGDRVIDASARTVLEGLRESMAGV